MSLLRSLTLPARPGRSNCMRSILTLLTLTLISASARADAPKIDFAHDILPILKTRCAGCHTNGKYKGSFSLDSREEILKQKAAVPGKSAASEIFKRVSSKDPEVRMPSKGEPLTEKQIALISAWIDQGLPWEAGFSFKAST